MLSLRHYNRNTTWFIILFSPTINLFFLWKICRCWKEKRQYLPMSLSFWGFKIALRALLKGWGGLAARQPEPPRSPTSECGARLQSWLLGIAPRRDRTCPTCPQTHGWLSVFPGHHQTFPGGGVTVGKEMPLSSCCHPSIHPSNGMQEPTLPSSLLQSRSD